MPTLQIKFCPRLGRFTLLALALAQLAGPANADVQIEVRGVGEDIRANVLAYLSFERYKNSDDLSPEFVERLQERSEREVRGALRPFGFYEPVVTSEVKPEGSGGEQNYRVIINIKPGDPVVVEKVDVKVTGPGAREKVFTDITGDLPIQTGDSLDHSNYEALKGGLLRAAATNGYLDARMLRSEMRVDPQAHTAQIAIEFETGERYRFGATTIKQDSIDDALIRRYVRYRENDDFDATELLRTQFALDDSQYFSTVEVLPEQRDREKHIVPISIVAEPNRRHRYSYGVGYGTDTQVRGTVAWEDRRVNQRGHRFRTEAKAAATAQSTRRALHRAHRRSGHRKIPAAAHRRTRAGRRHRRSHRQLHPQLHARARAVVRPRLAARDVRRIPARGIGIHRVEPHRHPVAADPGHQFLAGAAQVSRRGAVQPLALRGAARLAQRARIGFRLPAGPHAGGARFRHLRRSGTC